jgi:hypothetical protein
MKPLWLALLLKPLLAAVLLAAYYFIVIRSLRWLYPRLPRNRFVDFLFRERANRRPDYGPLLTDRQRNRGARGESGVLRKLP